MASSSWFPLAFLASLCLVKNGHLFCNADPTDGFTPVPLTEGDFDIQKPYDKPLQDRYSYINGVHKMWVYSTDKPFKPGSPTKPRTEIRIRGHDYSSGVWQFEGYGFVPEGTTGTSIMQILGSDGPILMLKVYDGQLNYHSQKLVEPNIYNRWMRVNVIHDVDANKLTVFINGVQKLEVEGRGPSTFYFKCGVYTQTDPSHYMESRWKNIRVLKKN
uniref:Citrate-binding protein n=2 Tax=Elaeis guineensis var. tenera TaxID=51953 RepID=A0A6I9RZQ2_ELAGV|nr:citrate-binding protein [Elaeis guineensis]